MKNETFNAFLQIGGESTGNGKKIQKGTAYEAAKRYGGIIFFLEHRFYGRSQPFTYVRPLIHVLSFTEQFFPSHFLNRIFSKTSLFLSI